MNFELLNKIIVNIQWVIIAIMWISLIIAVINAPIQYICAGSIIGAISYLLYLIDTDKQFVKY